MAKAKKKVLGKAPVTIRLDQEIIEWAKTEGANLGLKYQTVINMTLRKAAGLAK